MWAFQTLYDKGLVYEGFRVLAYCFRCETPLSNTETRMDDVYRDRTDPALTVTFQLDTGEKIAVWTTTPWTLPSNLALAVGPDIEYAVLEKDGEQSDHGCGAGRRVREGTGGLRAGRHRAGPRAGRAPLHPDVRLPGRAGRPERLPGARRRLRHRRGRHRRRAPGAGVRRGRPERLQRGRHPDHRDRGRPHPVHRARARPYQGVQVFDANKPIIRRAQGPGRGAAARGLHALVPALLALRHPAGLQGGVVVVRRGDQVPGPDGRAEPGDHLDAGAHQGRLVRQVAGQRPGLVDLPQPVLGLADPGVEVRRPELPAGRRLRLVRRAGARLRGQGHRPAPAVRGRADPAQPGRPDRAVHHAPGARGAGLLVRVRVDAVRPGALPVREQGLVRAPLPGRLHRRVHRADPRLVLHHARAGHRAVRPAGVPQLPEPRHPAGRRRPQDVQEPAQLPGRVRGVRLATARTRCAGC